MKAAEPFARFVYRRQADQTRASPATHPVVIIGAGPVGLTLAIDLKLRGIDCVLLDDQDRIGEGSRAICFAKRTLEIWDRLGCAA
ncbi:MAG: FAD-dependent oxidoreductase, partial [bacterium]